MADDKDKFGDAIPPKPEDVTEEGASAITRGKLPPKLCEALQKPVRKDIKPPDAPERIRFNFGLKYFRDGVWRSNPIFIQVLGICSALAVTNKVETTVFMGLALIFVTNMSAFLVSSIRKVTPRKVRLMTQMLIIAMFVIIVDQFFRAYVPAISKQLGPYVGLIITNCIILGRTEGFASQKPVHYAALDGFSNGLGYALVLLCISFFREALGSGTITFPMLEPIRLGIPQENLCQFMILAPGAFIMLGIFIWIAQWISPPKETT